MINKKLLSKVLNLDIEGISSISIYSDRVGYFYKDDYFSKTINIYELANECKKWAMKKRYYIFSRSFIKHENANIGAIAYIIKDILHGIPDLGHSDIESCSKGKTEPEAIFKACQWILENE